MAFARTMRNLVSRVSRNLRYLLPSLSIVAQPVAERPVLANMFADASHAFPV